MLGVPLFCELRDRQIQRRDPRGSLIACDRSGSAAMTAGAANVVARRAERAVETQRRLEEGRAAAERAAAEQAAQAASLRAAGLLH